MGYAKVDQKTDGIHQRQFCRAYVVDDGKKRIAFVSVDAGMISQLVKIEVNAFTNLFKLVVICCGLELFLAFFMY